MMNGDENFQQYERERRFLVQDKAVVLGWPWVKVTQAYLWVSDGYCSRVRLIQGLDQITGELVDIDATHAVKGPRVGHGRFESEATINDPSIAREFIRRCTSLVVKRRYAVHEDHAWDVDVFADDNDGLVIAELGGANLESVEAPEWAPLEVTSLDSYNNEQLALHPFRKWPKPSPPPDDVWSWT